MSAQLETEANITRQHIPHHMSGWASAALIYLGIVLTFTAVTLIGCIIWLLIW
jgi:hypothetical protein